MGKSASWSLLRGNFILKTHDWAFILQIRGRMLFPYVPIGEDVPLETAHRITRKVWH